jgi:murein DD-endopeptidase MepM/ murein hydrolase activator NlpD
LKKKSNLSRAAMAQIWLVFSLLLASCAPSTPAVVEGGAAAEPTATPAAEYMHTPAQPPQTATPTPTPRLDPSPTASASPTEAFALCSPLEDITLEELGHPDLLKNPFEMPRPGMDDGHHGADFSYWSRGARKEMLGLPVYSVLAGRVAGVLPDRPPYGNTIIIETAFESVPPHWLDGLALPDHVLTPTPSAALLCPSGEYPGLHTGQRSLYLLYAHLNNPPVLEIGEPVACGQAIGEVGTTGNSVNPHLHLETRAGPSGVTFDAMGHYDNIATEAERLAYCTWRISGIFQMFDPMRLISLQP